MKTVAACFLIFGLVCILAVGQSAVAQTGLRSLAAPLIAQISPSPPLHVSQNKHLKKAVAAATVPSAPFSFEQDTSNRLRDAATKIVCNSEPKCLHAECDGGRKSDAVKALSPPSLNGIRDQLFQPDALNIRGRSNSVKANRCDKPKSLRSGQTIKGILDKKDCTLGDNSYVDFYQFYGRAAQKITIEMRSSRFDAFLYLLDDGEQVETDDESAGGTDSRIRVALPVTGVYQIGANSFDALRTGGYKLSLTACNSPNEPNCDY